MVANRAKFSAKINFSLAFLLVGLLVLASQPFSASASVQAASLVWQDTNLTIPPHESGFCYDAARPDTILISTLTDASFDAGSGAGTFAYSLKNGQSTQINSAQLTLCGDNGLWYWLDSQRSKITRFSRDDPDGKPITRLPEFNAKDGSLMGYALDKSEWEDRKATRDQNHLWYTPDGGLSWQERGQSLAGAFVSLAVSPADGRSIYLLTRNFQTDSLGNFTCDIYFSADAGQTWDKRQEFSFGANNPAPTIATLGTKTAPVDALLKITIDAPIHTGPSYQLSLDGGRTFRERYYYCVYDCAPSYFNKAFYPGFWYGTDGVYQLSLISESEPDKNIYTFAYQLQTFQDPAHPQTLTLPDEVQNLYHPQIQAFASNPANLLLTASPDLTSSTPPSFEAWYSPDQGRSWQKIPDIMDEFLISPYAPFTVLGLKNSHFYRIDLPDADKTLAKGVLSNKIGNGSYFDLTNHNLSGIFKTYWEQHGGLSLFGYPKTETFREVNPSDGKVYLVQYYERNRFEYHPENAGTPYEVLLGLLGNQLTEQRRAVGEGAFKPFPDMHYPGGAYFSQTGHNLRNSFKTYWETSGGLAIYGFPISEEFEEVNPDDGKTYVVQYFERNRFEYHPEFKGTKSEVLLGLLGNALLRQKNWL